MHCALRLERLFDALFLGPCRTRLRGGGDEPRYLPATADRPALIIYREDYFASALHEVAHWCIAGPDRRALEDYGYWYLGDGRDAEAQRAFERVECRPQALERVFAEACGFPFRPSFDNLDGAVPDAAGFTAAVARERERWLREGLPLRARRFRAALESVWGPGGGA